MAEPRLAGKVIVIIGGTSGLGLSAARACVREGARVVAVGRQADKCAAVAKELGERARTLVGDATQPECSRLAIAEAEQAFGSFDGLYHVAGGSGRSYGDGPLAEISEEGWQFTLRLNLDSLFFSNRAAIQAWLASGRGGAILNMASVLAWSPAPRFFATHAYATTKAAAIGMTTAAAAYYAPHNIRLNALAPALVETPLAQRAVNDPQIMEYIATKQPLEGGRVGMPTDADAAVVFLLSDAARFITGQVLAVDGGWSISEGQIPPTNKDSE